MSEIFVLTQPIVSEKQFITALWVQRMDDWYTAYNGNQKYLLASVVSRIYSAQANFKKSFFWDNCYSGGQSNMASNKNIGLATSLKYLSSGDHFSLLQTNQIDTNFLECSKLIMGNLVRSYPFLQVDLRGFL